MQYQYDKQQTKKGERVITLAIQPCSLDEARYAASLLVAGNKDVRLKLKVGAANCSPKDIFNKAKGRSLAESRMEEIEVIITDLIVTNGRAQLSFETDDLEIIGLMSFFCSGNSSVRVRVS
jgi:hypothetical protein